MVPSGKKVVYLSSTEAKRDFQSLKKKKGWGGGVQPNEIY